jgi:Zn-dependent protease
MLGVFNLLPLAPLDGSRIVAWLVPTEHVAAYAKLQRSGPGLLVAIIMLDYALAVGILWGNYWPGGASVDQRGHRLLTHYLLT